MLISKPFWRPCNADQSNITHSPIVRTSGVWVHLKNGVKLLDATSSWWCKSLGHRHPAITKAIENQLQHYDHVLSADLSEDLIEMLSARLIASVPNLSRVFYASDGSSAVEIAMKMSLHARYNTQSTRSLFASLHGGYHGETLGALSVTHIPHFTDPYQHFMPASIPISTIPFTHSLHTTYDEVAKEKWEKTEQILEHYKHELTAIIVEPILQAASGMHLYHPQFLTNIAAWCRDHDVHLILDEIMTGYYRTGKMFAFEYAAIQPDILCIGKGMTSGTVPMSATLASESIFQACYNGAPWLHSHTYSGYALGAAAAIATLDVIGTLSQSTLEERAAQMVQAMQKIQEKTGIVENLRHIGYVVAADIVLDMDTKSFKKYIDQANYQHGILLRPIGKTLYWCPPLTIETHEIEHLMTSTQAVLNELLNPIHHYAA